MANPLAKTLIAIVAAFVAGGHVAAQDDSLFQEAVRKLRTNDRDTALAKLREFLASNPGNEDALRLYASTETSVWQMLLAEEGEFSTIARHLMSLAGEGRKQMSRDEAAIGDLVAQATTGASAGERIQASVNLAAAHGEFAVPALLSVLGDGDNEEAQNYAILALMRIGSKATLPLVEALAVEDDLTRRNVASAIRNIGDRRAAAAMARVANEDSNEAIREIARAALSKFGVAAGTSAVDLHTRDAHEYLTGSGLSGFDSSEVVWTWKDGQLVAHDVPAQLYHLELSKKAAHSAMRLDPANDAAKTLLARSYLAQSAAIRETLAANPDDEAMQALSGKIGSLEMVALTTGTETLRRALVDSLDERMLPVAVAAIEALGASESRDSLASSPLATQALGHGDSRVAYAAALALSKAAAGSPDLPMASKVVDVLAHAVTEQGRRFVKVVGGGDSARQAVAAAAKMQGSPVEAGFEKDGSAAIASLLNFPHWDVIVIDETLSDSHPRDIIRLARKYSPQAKVLLRTLDEAAASEAYGETVDGYIEGELSGDALVAKATELVENLDPRRTEANDVAVAASMALHDLAASKIDVSGALDDLAGQLARGDAIAIPAVQALGAGGNAGNLGALMTVLADASASGELKVAAANAAGNILARSDAVPAAGFEAMLAIAGDDSIDMALRRAVVTAMGKGKLAPGERLKLAELLSTIAQVDGEL